MTAANDETCTTTAGNEGLSGMIDDAARGSAVGGPGQETQRKKRSTTSGVSRTSGVSETMASVGSLPVDDLAPRRGLRRVVAAVILVEGVTLLAVTMFLVVELFVSTPTETGGAIAQAVITVLIGLALLQLGRVVLRADERARIPVLVWQVLQASVGVPALSSRWYVGVALLAAAGIAGIGVLLPGVLRPDVRGLEVRGPGND